MLRVGRGIIPEEYREFRARQLFGLSQPEYEAMDARKLDLWFEFHAAEVKAQEEAERRRSG